MNFFSPESAAERYVIGRPYFHPAAIQRIKKVLSLSEPVTRALDVGCGTGLSTIALKEIAEQIVGVDASRAMIARAPKDSRIEYCVAAAEKLPFSECEFDLTTLSSALHWLDRSKFCAEAHRVLRPEGWLIVYDNYFSAQMKEDTDFQAWHRDVCLAKYPSPARAIASFTSENSERHGFRLIHQEHYENIVSFSVEELVDYLMTQSNVIARVEGGTEDIGEVRLWLMKNIRPLFRGLKGARFLFAGPIWYLQNAAEKPIAPSAP